MPAAFALPQVMSMIPGFNEQLMPKGMEKESQARIKRFMTMMDSMTDEGERSFWSLPIGEGYSPHLIKL